MNDDYLPNCFAVSNNELEAAASVAAGDTLDCDRCSKKHVVTSDAENVLQFVQCRGKGYLVGVKGKSIIRRNTGKGV